MSGNEINHYRLAKFAGLILLSANRNPNYVSSLLSSASRSFRFVPNAGVPRPSRRHDSPRLRGFPSPTHDSPRPRSLPTPRKDRRVRVRFHAKSERLLSRARDLMCLSKLISLQQGKGTRRAQDAQIGRGGPGVLVLASCGVMSWCGCGRRVGSRECGFSFSQTK